MDRAIVTHLAVRRAEHRFGRALEPSMTCEEIAEATFESADRIRARLDALTATMRVVEASQQAEERWALPARHPGVR